MSRLFRFFPLLGVTRWILCGMLLWGIGFAYSLAHSQPLTHRSSPTDGVLRPAVFAVLVGNNLGYPSDRPLRYAQSDTLRMAQTLREIGGIPKHRIQRLIGLDPQTLIAALSQTDAAIRAFRQRHPNHPTHLLFYYSGHADPHALHLGSQALAYPTLREILRRSSAHLRILILDTCQSGQMLRLKGARRIKRHFALPSAWQTPLQGEAILTASGIGEDAHELESLRGSIFTHHLISALRGLADHNQDGLVTLEEAYSYTYQKTISHTLFLSSGVQHPSFRKSFRGHGHVILTYPQKAPSRLILDTALAGHYYVLQPEKQLLLAEIKKRLGEPVHLGLEAGSYTIIYRSKGGYQSKQIDLHQGKPHRLKRFQGRLLSYAAASNKGIAWLTHPAQLKRPTPYLTAFYAALGVTLAGAVATGTLYGVSHKLYGDARTPLEQSGGTGMIDQSLVDASTRTNIGGTTALGITLAASLAATVFFILHHQHNHPPSAITATRPHTPAPSSSPAVHSTPPLPSTPHNTTRLY
ncbi:caspase family protein [Myxococcota bacterium]|nr:caspase family protein [Myxococcota bacterium]